MKATINYKAVDPYYSDQTQTFIGETQESINKQIEEFEKYLGREHPAGVSTIYIKEKSF